MEAWLERPLGYRTWLLRCEDGALVRCEAFLDLTPVSFLCYRCTEDTGRAEAVRYCEHTAAAERFVVTSRLTD